jgi:hypothetical protein
MSFAYVDVSWSQYCTAVLAEHMQYRGLARCSDFERCDSACVEQTIRKPIKVRSKVAQRFARA